MTTRFRALAIATLTTLLFLLTLLGFLGEQPAAADIFSTLVFDFGRAATIGVVMTLGTLWVLYFKRKGNSFMTVGMFPAVAIAPYILFTDTIIDSIFAGLAQIPSAVLASLLFWLCCYLLILTANVLNGALLYSIPLGQAGKAAQFVFSLISAYFLVAYVFGSAFPLPVRVGAIAAYCLYVAYSSVWTLQVPQRQAVLSAFGIALVMALVIAVLSVWPIASVYATVIAVVLLYILLNVALEMREHIGTAVWVEYGALLVICLVILCALADWGINGTVF